MDPSNFSVLSSELTTDELRWFYWIDREIFCRLVLTLGRDVEESVRIIALWLWLESVGFPNIVIKLISLPDMVLNFVANEAVNLLHALESRRCLSASQNNEEQMKFTNRLFNAVTVTFSFVTENKVSAIQSISKFITDVATRVFGDIIQRAMNRRAQLLNSSFDNFRPIIPPHVGPSIDSSVDIGLTFSGLRIGGGETDIRGKQVLMGPGSGPSGLFSPFSNSQFVPGGPSSTSAVPHLQNLPFAAADDTTGTGGVIPDDRSLFITFSRGYPINEGEIRSFFTWNYGDCIEAVHMQEVQHGQAMFARLVLRSTAVMDLILQQVDEEGKVKFVINAKHAWARKYFPKNNNIR